jgi:hypothetical protein
MPRLSLDMRESSWSLQLQRIWHDRATIKDDLLSTTILQGFGAF